MAASLKLLAIATPIVGGGIGAPVYSLTANKNTVLNSPQLQGDLPESSGAISQKAEELKKVSCSSSDVTPRSASATFLSEQSKDDKLYSYVSCYDSRERREDASPFGANWTALFPKDVLNKTFSIGRGKGFEMNVQTTKGQEDWTDSVITFSDSKKQSSLKVRWSSVLDTNQSQHKQTFLTSIEGGEHTLKDVYFTIDLPTRSTGELGH